MEFDNVPKIYEAVEAVNKNASGDRVVIEVLQQLGNNKVRGIAMDSTDGLKK
jgi:F-type H+-transporting ATPase subunit beta